MADYTTPVYPPDEHYYQSVPTERLTPPPHVRVLGLLTDDRAYALVVRCLVVLIVIAALAALWRLGWWPAVLTAVIIAAAWER